MSDALPAAFVEEITEDCVEGDMPLEAIAKLQSFKVPKGIGRASLVLMARRINHESAGDPVPKKTINRINYEFLKTAISATDPAVRLAYFKEFHDRLDGKAAQAVNLGNHEGKALTLTVAQADTNVL